MHRSSLRIHDQPRHNAAFSKGVARRLFGLRKESATLIFIPGDCHAGADAQTKLTRQVGRLGDL